MSTLKTLIQSVQGLGLHTALRAVRYHNTLRTLNRRFGAKKPRGPFLSPGSVTAFEQHERGVRIHAERGSLDLTFVTAGVLRVRMRTEPDFPPPFSYAVTATDWPPSACALHNDQQFITAYTDHLICRVDRATGKLTITTPTGHVLSEDAAGITWRGREIRWTRKLPAAERAYGLGQRASALDLRGKRLALWNSDPMPAYPRDADPVYYSIPFYLGVQDQHVIGILWDNPARGSVDIGAAQPDALTFAAESGELRFYVFTGSTVEEVLKAYTTLTGRAPLPPLWALGYHQSRWGYDAESVFRELAQEFRTREIPCDTLYFDIDYMDGYRVFTWDHERFPRLPHLLKELGERGFKAVAIVDPGVKVDDGYTLYQDALKQNVFLKYPHGKPVIAPVWPGNCLFPDFTSARVRAWWAAQLPTLINIGFAGFWNDMNEPAVITGQRGSTLADYVIHDWDSAGANHAGGGHNVYGMLMSRATREGVARHQPDKRPFVITRATYAGGQRYASSWTGDNDASWEHLRLSISMVLNAGLSGMAFTGPDVGGFAGEPDGELFTRWMQAASMMPYFRAHTIAGTKGQEPWQYGERYETIIRQAIEQRYQLLPTIYSTFAHNSQTGAPIIRPLFMVDPDDDALYAVNDAFMLGESILVAPVVEPGATERTITLPRGVWYDYHSGRMIEGGRTITVSAPLERLPLFVRAGTVIPLWPTMQYVGEKPIEEARLRIFTGNNETTLYEDAGEGMAYLDGDYRWSYFTCQFLPSGQFAINWRRAGHYQPPYTQARVEIVGIASEPEAILLDDHAAPIWYYEDGIVEFIVKPFSEARIVERDLSDPSARETRVHKPRG